MKKRIFINCHNFHAYEKTVRKSFEFFYKNIRIVIIWLILTINVASSTDLIIMIIIIYIIILYF